MVIIANATISNGNSKTCHGNYNDNDHDNYNYIVNHVDAPVRTTPSNNCVSRRKRISNKALYRIVSTKTMTLLALLTVSTTRRTSVSGNIGNVVRAFSTLNTPAKATTCFHTTSIQSQTQTRSHRPRNSIAGWHTSVGFSTDSKSIIATAATVEDDLDSALDDILGSVFQEAGDPIIDSIDQAVDEAVDGAAQLSVNADEDITIDAPQDESIVGITDPKNANFLSTSNPHWTNSGMNRNVIDALSAKGITHFTEVQGTSFAPVLAGRDVIGRSRTGTGKTLAFGIPALHRLEELAKSRGTVDSYGRRRKGRKVSMIVLCPTRELARQVSEELDGIAKLMGLYTALFHGGVSYDPQTRALRNGIDILVGTPGRVIDHINRGTLNLSECDIVVLDEADEMLNMGFAEDVEVVLDGVGSDNEEKTQCLLFSATTPGWVKSIGRQYQTDVLSIDATTDQGVRTATTVRHVAIQVPFGKRDILEDIIAVEISKDLDMALLAPKTPIAEDADVEAKANTDMDDLYNHNPIAAAAVAAKKKSSSFMQQKIFGKTIVFTETKREADELVSGGVFKSLTAQALHGDVGQKQRDATLAAFRAGAFNVLVATDVAARGIDIKDVDLVVQFAPPRETDTYVHRSGRTGRAGKKGTSVLLFDQRQARDIVKIERGLGHGFKFELIGPPSSEAALIAASKTSAIACKGIPDETAEFFMESAQGLLAGEESAEAVVAKCLAAISRRGQKLESRSLLTGESGFVTVEMSNSKGRDVSPGDVMFTVSKLSRLSRQEQEGEGGFDGDVGKIQAFPENGVAAFDMGVEDAKKLVEFSKEINTGGAVFKVLRELEIERGSSFGQGRGGGRGYGGGRGRGRGRGGGRGGGRGYSSSFGGRGRGGGGRGGDRRTYGGSNYESRQRGGGGRGSGGGRGGNSGGQSNFENQDRYGGW